MTNHHRHILKVHRVDLRHVGHFFKSNLFLSHNLLFHLVLEGSFAEGLGFSLPVTASFFSFLLAVLSSLKEQDRDPKAFTNFAQLGIP